MTRFVGNVHETRSTFSYSTGFERSQLRHPDSNRISLRFSFKRGVRLWEFPNSVSPKIDLIGSRSDCTFVCHQHLVIIRRNKGWSWQSSKREIFFLHDSGNLTQPDSGVILTRHARESHHVLTSPMCDFLESVMFVLPNNWPVPVDKLAQRERCCEEQSLP